MLLVLDAELLLYLLELSVGVFGPLGCSRVGGNSVTFTANKLLHRECLVSFVCVVALLILELATASGRLCGFCGSLMFKLKPYCCLTSLSDSRSSESSAFLCLELCMPPCAFITRFMLPLQTDSVVLLWNELMNLLLSVRFGELKPLLSCVTKGVFDLSLTFVTSLNV